MTPDSGWLVRGLVLGFSIAAPVGPIGVLCIRRTLAEGRVAGLVTGLGAATADALYGAVAAFGLAALTNALVTHQHAVRLVGGAFLLVLGVRTFLATPASHAAGAGGMTLASAYASTFVLTLTNPMTILSFAAVFAGLGFGAGASNTGAAVQLVLGVLVGSALWWLALSGAVGALRSRFDVRALQWVNRVSGLVILGFGVFALASLIMPRGGA